VPVADDNVAPFPSASERLAKRAMQAQQQYAAAVADTVKGRRQAIAAVAEYGAALMEGRQEHRSNKAFAEWVSANKLDVGKPWDKQQERHAATQIAKIVHSTNAVDGFADCPHATPTHIMSWYRKLHPSPQAKEKAEATAKAMEAIKTLEARGEVVTEDKIGDLAGVAAGTANKAFTIHRKMKEAADQATAETTERIAEDQALARAEATFSEKSKITVAKAIEILLKRQKKMFQTIVGEEVRRRIAAADDATRKHNKELHAQVLGLTRMLQQKVVFTPDEYKTIMVCLHPDNSASQEKRARAFDLFRQKERRLTGQ
jgi:hypothetical protein